VLVLALDTSSPAVSAALVRVEPQGREVLAEHVVVDARRHGELLALGVRAVLDGRPATELAAVVVGPRSRSVHRSARRARDRRVDGRRAGRPGVRRLLPGRRRAGRAGGRHGARRKEVYWARYDTAGRVDGPAVERPADLAERLRGSAHGWSAPGRAAPRRVRGLPVDDSASTRRGRLVALAADRLLAGAPSEALTPLYLRRPDAVQPGATEAGHVAGGEAR
jgi:tRNA A37 threonylcarbamoyladenosine modification protein TsaB